MSEVSQKYRKHGMEVLIFDREEVFTGVANVSGNDSSGDGWGPDIQVETGTNFS